MFDLRELLKEVGDRASRATEGPWEWGQGDLCHLGGFVAGPEIHYEAVWANRASDAEFIAASRADVPALVAALEAVLALAYDSPEGETGLDGVLSANQVIDAITDALGAGQ